MLVPSRTVASLYYKFCIYGSTSPGYYGHPFVPLSPHSAEEPTWKLNAQLMVLNVTRSADAPVPQADPAGTSARLANITAESWNSPNIVYLHLLAIKTKTNSVV
jgi:hypothetical protein